LCTGSHHKEPCGAVVLGEDVLATYVIFLTSCLSSWVELGSLTTLNKAHTNISTPIRTMVHDDPSVVVGF